MQTVIDLIGAAIVAGVVFLLGIQMTTSAGNLNHQTMLDGITQENSTTIASIIDNDFCKIGYSASSTLSTMCIQYADSQRIVFRADIDRDGKLDTIRYYTTLTTYPVPNSTAKYQNLYRVVSSVGSFPTMLGITLFKLKYYDKAGSQIVFSSPTDSISIMKIKSIKVKMTVANPMTGSVALTDQFNTTFATTDWDKYISPKNLRYLK